MSRLHQCQIVCYTTFCFMHFFIGADSAVGWPGGSYTLPMPVTGCPSGTASEWLTGSRRQITEKGSHASSDNHMNAIDSSYIVTQKFCTHWASEPNGHKWMPGQYCVMKKQACPEDFHEGWVYWDDAASFIGRTKQSTVGVSPDGEFDRNTKIYYCCRRDGYASNAIRLPTHSAFYLFKYGDRCQEVKKMSVTEEWIYWADEKSMNLNSRGGVYPSMSRLMYPTQFTKLYYCFYQPEQASSRLRVLMTVIIVIGVLVLIATIAACVVCILRRAFSRRHPPSPAESGGGDGLMPPPIILQPPPRRAGAAKSPLPSAPPPDGDGDWCDPLMTVEDIARPPSYATVMREDRIAHC